MQICDFTPNDYAGLSALQNAIYPNRPRTPEGWAQIDKERHPKCKFRRWVAVEDGTIIGSGGYDQDITDYAPHRFYVDFKVMPDHQRRGIGSALYEHVMTMLDPYEPHVLRANSFEDQLQGLKFMQQRGFYEAWRETPVRLDLAKVDLTPYQDLESRLRKIGIQIKTMRELEGNLERNRKLYDLYRTIDLTLPREENSEVEQISIEDWSRMTFDDPSVLQDAYFIATHGDEYIGLKEIRVDASNNMVWAGLMGVLPEYRRQGIGMALQARTISYSRDKGFSSLSSSTGAINQAMQAIFTRLGYTHLPVWYQLQKDIPRV
jgi:GNAT superfamily N-acetyltransferase